MVGKVRRAEPGILDLNIADYAISLGLLEPV